MNEATGNIFQTDCDAVVITTNGFVKANGECVMGKGCAKQVANMLPQVPKILGTLLKLHGNHVFHITSNNDTALLSFPVKPTSFVFQNELDCEYIVKHMRYKFNVGAVVPGWACVADVEIIKQSALELVDYVNKTNWTCVVLPRPGCGAGELSWGIVKPILESILDDRFVCMTF